MGMQKLWSTEEVKASGFTASRVRFLECKVSSTLRMFLETAIMSFSLRVSISSHSSDPFLTFSKISTPYLFFLYTNSWLFVYVTNGWLLSSYRTFLRGRISTFPSGT